jgi:hypothetical protein
MRRTRDSIGIASEKALHVEFAGHNLFIISFRNDARQHHRIVISETGFTIQ